jgi:Flp pilus assembly protein TadD
LGDLQNAIPPLEKAEALEPDRPMPHVVLSDVFSRLGREEDAKRERAEAERLGAVPDAPTGLQPEVNQSNPD